QRVDDAHPRLAILLLVSDRLPEEVEAHQRRLAALPGEGHLGHALRLDILPGVLFQQRAGHAKVAVRIEALFGEEVAVFAVQVADRPARLDHDVEGGRAGMDRHGSRPCPVLWRGGLYHAGVPSSTRGADSRTNGWQTPGEHGAARSKQGTMET